MLLHFSFSPGCSDVPSHKKACLRVESWEFRFVCGFYAEVDETLTKQSGKTVQAEGPAGWKVDCVVSVFVI